MGKYNIDLKVLSYDNGVEEQKMLVWKGQLTGIRDRKDASMPVNEGFLRENKDVAIQDIQNRLRRHRVNFNEDEVIWAQTKERIRSEADLYSKIQQIGH